MTAERRANFVNAHGRGVILLALLAMLGVSLALLPGCQEPAADTTAAAKQKQPELIPITPIAVSNEPAPVPPGTTQESPSQKATGTPKIQVKNPVHDFGEVGPESRHTARIEFTNVGDAPLQIQQVKSCCGVQTKGVEAGQRYTPGQSGALEITFMAGPYPGVVTRNLYIQTNDPVQPAATLTIKANIAQRVDYSPKRLKLFLKEANAGCGDIKVFSVDGRPFSIVGFRSTAETITAQFDPNLSATEFVLKPQADMEKLQRHMRGQISIDLTHPECKNLRILYDVVPEFTVSPSTLTLLNLKPEQPVQRDIWILSNYRDDFEIESVTSQKGLVKVIEQKKVGNRYQLRVEVTPPAVENGRIVLADSLQVKIKDGETLPITCQGFYATR